MKIPLHPDVLKNKNPQNKITVSVKKIGKIVKAVVLKNGKPI